MLNNCLQYSTELKLIYVFVVALRRQRMGMHFAGLMYNARTDTLFSKPTFSRLAKEGRSCVVALDGYFEWKASPLGGGKGKKQPYFVHRKRKSNNDDASTVKDHNRLFENPLYAKTQ